MKSKMRTKILATLLSVAMVMNGSIPAFASEAAPAAIEETGHKHTDECFTEEKVLICEDTTVAHAHGEGCYTTNITCGQEECEGHSHTDDCYDITVSTCGKDEHSHSDECNSEESPCEKEEHSHNDGCTTETKELKCGQEVTSGHAHDDSCYTKEKTCTLEEIEAHVHGDGCYKVEKKLTCTFEEVAPAAEDKTACETCGELECTCEEVEETACETCGELECTCEEVKETACETCGEFECTCEEVEEKTACETCGELECTCEVVEEAACVCGDETCECTTCEEGCTCTEKPVESLEYVDDDIKVTVTALEEGAIPAGASLKVTPIEKREVTEEMSEEEKQEVEEINAEYDLTEEKLEEKMQDEEETKLAGFLVYDIKFVTEDGIEIEPNGEVKVELKLNKVLPEEVKESKLEVQDVTIIHLEEDANGEVKDVVDMNESEQLEKIDTTEENAVETAEFKTISFSKFVITWIGTTITLDAMCVDSAGNELKAFESDKSGNNPVEVDVIRRVLASSDKDLSALNIYIQGYEYSGAYIKIGDQPIIENVQQISYDENDGWKYKVNGQAEKNLIGSGILYLKYATLNGDAASKINTIGSEDGITLNLYDYTSDVNSGKKFQFRGSGGQEGTASVSTENPLNIDGYKPGVLNRKLDTEGNPKLSNTYGGDSLAYLFNSSTSGVTAYTGLSGLFRKASGGWYVYDSGENHAQLNTTTNSIDVYDATLFPYNTADKATLEVGGFLPFNQLPANAVRNGEYCLTKTEGDMNTFPDYWLGLNLVTDFEQPENGKVNRQDMIFSFSGDDDMWVFIDGNLVLDIGGTHGPLSGYINFATGIVHVDSKWEETYKNIYNPSTVTKDSEGNITGGGTTADTYIGELYKEAGMDAAYLNAMFKKSADGTKYTTFKDNTPHTMKVFYFERASSQSNCKIEFNIQPTNFGEVNVEKEITSHSIDLSKLDAATKEDVAFKFVAEYTAPGTTEVVKSGLPYVLIGADGNVISNETVTGANGEFYLKTGQEAKFDKLRVGGTFKVTEVDVPGHGCDEATVISPDQDTETKVFTSETTDKDLAGKQITVTNDPQTYQFKNAADLKGYLVIRKDLTRYNETLKGATFIFEVTATVGDTTVYNDVVAMNFTEPAVKEHRIDGLPAGASVAVTEVYTGAGYVNTKAPIGAIVIPAECNVNAGKATEVVFSFENNYKDGRINSGSSVVNTFEKNAESWGNTQVFKDQDAPEINGQAALPTSVTGENPYVLKKQDEGDEELNLENVKL